MPVSLFIDAMILGGIYSLSSLSLGILLGIIGLVNLGHGAWLLTVPLVVSGLINHSFTGLEPFLYLIVLCLFPICLWYFSAVPAHKGSHSALLYPIVMGVGFISIVQDGISKIIPGGIIELAHLKTGLNLPIVGMVSPKILITVITYLLYFVMFLFLKSSKLGLAIRAMSIDQNTCNFLGINTFKVYLLVFLISSFFAYGAGVAMALIYPLTGSSVLTITVKSLIIVGLCKYFTSIAIVVNAITFALAEQIISYFLGNGVQDLLPYFVLVIMLNIRPWRKIEKTTN